MEPRLIVRIKTVVKITIWILLPVIFYSGASTGWWGYIGNTDNTLDCFTEPGTENIPSDLNGILGNTELTAGFNLSVVTFDDVISSVSGGKADFGIITVRPGEDVFKMDPDLNVFPVCKFSFTAVVGKNNPLYSYENPFPVGILFGEFGYYNEIDSSFPHERIEIVVSRTPAAVLNSSYINIDNGSSEVIVAENIDELTGAVENGTYFIGIIPSFLRDRIPKSSDLSLKEIKLTDINGTVYIIVKGKPRGNLYNYIKELMKSDSRHIFSDNGFIPLPTPVEKFGSACPELIITGSTTVFPIAAEAADIYTMLNPEVRIFVSGTGSGTGILSVATGLADIGMASRPIKTEPEGNSEHDKWPSLINHTVARDGIIIIVHPSNPVDNLDIRTIREIFAGNITNWKQIGGPDHFITLIGRECGSGTRDFFYEHVMGGIPFSGYMQALSSNGAVHDAVASDKYAIGFCGMSYADNEVKALAIDGIKPGTDTVLNGSYPLSRDIYFVTVGNFTAGTLAYDFWNFITDTRVGQWIIEDAGYIAPGHYKFGL